jgi:hypothetical protein
MSLEPRWYSTIYGLLFMVGQALAALAFSITVLIWLSGSEPLSEAVRPSYFQDLGSFLLAFVMLWAYLEFSQFLIIWGGNLSEEIPWYIRRMQGIWGRVGLLLVLLNFALPFFLLLFRNVKRRTGSLLLVAALVLVMRLVDMCCVWWRRCPPHMDEHPASFRHGRNLARVFHLAVAADADSAGARPAHGRSGAACRRAWINHTALLRPRHVTRPAMRTFVVFSLFSWF